ncbi:MAG: shikimate kinase [Acidimicrobiia bacterium]|nr:MAG: shikimate kinase [Acidimicrobiia bacterium]
MNLWLVGMMGSGKTTVGRVVAARTDRPFRDVDLIVAERLGTSIPDLWQRDGEDSFRAIESAIIGELASGSGAIISTGGGAILREGNRNAMRRTGTVVWLQATAPVLASRVGGSLDRPVLGGGGEGRLAELLEDRAAAYEEAADHTVNTDGRTPAEVADEVAAWV